MHTNSPLTALPADACKSVDSSLSLALNGEMSMSMFINYADDVALTAKRNGTITREQCNAITEYVRSF